MPQTPFDPQSPYNAQAYATAAISMLEGLLQLLRANGIVSDDQVRDLFSDRAAAWDGASVSPLNSQVASLLRFMAGQHAPARDLVLDGAARSAG